MPSPMELFNERFTTIEAKLDQNADIDQTLISNLREIKIALTRINEFSHNYDYEDIQGNGYHSFIALCYLFEELVIDLFSRGKLQRINCDLVEISGILLTITGLLAELKEDANHHHQSLEDNNSHEEEVDIYAKSDEMFLKILATYKSMVKRLGSIYGLSCGFWLCPSLRRAMRAFTTIMAIYATNSARSSVKCIINNNYRGNILAQVAHSTNVHFIKSFWSLTEYSFIRDTVSNIFGLQPKVAKDIVITDLQTSYIIPSLGEMVVKVIDPESTSKGRIRCRYLLEPVSPSSNEPDDVAAIEEYPGETLVFHCHGGGFVSQSPNSHEVYLREWSRQLAGIPILSIDYILSPEGKYPEALQQILDVYLWLVGGSNEEKVKQEIGFVPKKIVFCGDSAGGNLVTALLLVLNDIKLNYDGNLQMPAALLCIYTPLMLKLYLSPSRMFTAFDTVLPLGVLLSCLEAYIDTREEEDMKISPSSETLATVIGNGSSNCLDEQSRAGPGPRGNCKSDDEMDEAEQDLFKFAQLNFLTDRQKSEEDSSGTGDETIGEEDDFVIINKEDLPDDDVPVASQFPNDFSYKFQRSYYKTINRIKRKFFGSSLGSFYLPQQQLSFEEVMKNLAAYGQKPFYQETGDALVRKIKILNSRGSHPYISPLLYKNFASLSDIPISIVAGEFDIFLDDSISFAKTWKGQVYLDICPRLPHGSLNFIMFSEEAKQLSDLCVKRIQQLIN